MKTYQNILLAVELIPANDHPLIQRALELSKEFNAKLSLVHVVERVSSYGAAYGVAVGADIEQMLLENAKKQMVKLGNTLDVPESRQFLKIGPAPSVILEEADHIHADLIVIGSHGRHGIRLLLGSTANGVLHGAKCEVLAVRLQK
jgi:universal stress protein A